MNTKYYHGGQRGISIGDSINPPDFTGQDTLANWGNDLCRTDRVYVTTDFGAALLYAVGHPSGKGKVYEVEPVGTPEQDMDCREEGLSFSCESAKVVKVFKITSKTRKLALKALQELA